MGLAPPLHNRCHAPDGAPKFVFFTGMATGHRRYAGKPHPSFLALHASCSSPPQGEGAVRRVGQVPPLHNCRHAPNGAPRRTLWRGGLTDIRGVVGRAFMPDVFLLSAINGRPTVRRVGLAPRRAAVAMRRTVRRGAPYGGADGGYSGSCRSGIHARRFLMSAINGRPTRYRSSILAQAAVTVC